MPSAYTKSLHNEADFCAKKMNSITNNSSNADLLAAQGICTFGTTPLTLQAMGVCLRVRVYKL